MDIDLKELSYIYHPHTPFQEQAIDNLSLTIPHGTFQAIVGKTGSGKSTLIQIIAGLLRPTSGRIQVGEHIVSAKTKQIPYRLEVGIVFQYPEHQLFAETVYRDIAYGPTNQGLPSEMVFKRVHSAIQMVGLSPNLLEQSPFTLSGGQMRRVAIAGVLAMEPSILILDEPTAGLDQQAKEQLLTLIERLHEEKQRTIILVTHHMDEVVRLSGSVMAMDQGKCSYLGSPDDLFQRPDVLLKHGLEPPDITKLIYRLNGRVTPPIPTSIFKLEDLVSYLEHRRRGEDP